MEDISTEISKKLDFWKCIVNLYKQTNYNMVTIPKNYYQELLIGKEAPSYLTAPLKLFIRSRSGIFRLMS